VVLGVGQHRAAAGPHLPVRQRRPQPEAVAA